MEEPRLLTLANQDHRCVHDVECGRQCELAPVLQEWATVAEEGGGRRAEGAEEGIALRGRPLGGGVECAVGGASRFGWIWDGGRAGKRCVGGEGGS